MRLPPVTSTTPIDPLLSRPLHYIYQRRTTNNFTIIIYSPYALWLFILFSSWSSLNGIFYSHNSFSSSSCFYIKFHILSKGSTSSRSHLLLLLLLFLLFPHRSMCVLLYLKMLLLLFPCLIALLLPLKPWLHICNVSYLSSTTHTPTLLQSPTSHLQ